MSLHTKNGVSAQSKTSIIGSKINESLFSKDYVDFLNDAGWRLEKKFPSNSNNYSDLLEDTEWKSIYNDYGSLKHYRRDLDALS